MSEDKKPAAPKKPAIVTKHTLLKDQGAADESAKSADEPSEKVELKHTTETKISPLNQADAPAVPAPQEKPAPAEQPAPEAGKDNKENAKSKPPSQPDAQAAERAKHDAAIQKLIDSRKYELPINATEKSKSKHFVALGVILTILLVVVWADIALDAGLIHLGGLHSVTHFFSN